MAVWRDWRDEFLNETLRRHGLGEAFHRPRCATCGISFKPKSDPVTQSSTAESSGDPAVGEGDATDDSSVTTPVPDDVDSGGVPEDSVDVLYRCRVCGEWKECGACCLARHQRTPLHRIEVCLFCLVFGFLVN